MMLNMYVTIRRSSIKMRRESSLDHVMIKIKRWLRSHFSMLDRYDVQVDVLFFEIMLNYVINFISRQILTRRKKGIYLKIYIYIYERIIQHNSIPKTCSWTQTEKKKYYQYFGKQVFFVESRPMIHKIQRIRNYYSYVWIINTGYRE